MSKVSVLLSVYNGERYLAAALDSILSQSLTDWEFVIVDDGSTDGSADIIREYSRGDRRIVHLESVGNQGLIRALNRGIAACSGEYLARQDADDVSEPARLEVQAAFLSAHPGHVLVGSRFDEIDEEGRVLGAQRVPFFQTDSEIQRHKYRKNPFAHSSVMIRKEVVIAVGGYREQSRHAEDYDLWLRILKRGKGHNLPDVLLHRRITPGMITLTRKRELLATVLKTKVHYIREFGAADFFYLFRDLARLLKTAVW